MKVIFWLLLVLSCREALSQANRPTGEVDEVKPFSSARILEAGSGAGSDPRVGASVGEEGARLARVIGDFEREMRAAYERGRSDHVLDLEKAASDGSTRSVVIYLHNESDAEFEMMSSRVDRRSTGRWVKEPDPVIPGRDIGSWGTKSSGYWEGTSGSAIYRCTNCSTIVKVDWDNPYVTSNDIHASFLGGNDGLEHGIRQSGRRGVDAVVRFFLSSRNCRLQGETSTSRDGGGAGSSDGK